jgi:hypothetical protein
MGWLIGEPSVPTTIVPLWTTAGAGIRAPPTEHYRAGTDCALCDCPRYRAKHPVRAGWQRLLRERPAG